MGDSPIRSGRLLGLFLSTFNRDGARFGIVPVSFDCLRLDDSDASSFGLNGRGGTLHNDGVGSEVRGCHLHLSIHISVASVDASDGANDANLVVGSTWSFRIES
jgi:hypothetical protein